jgi:hypothetical protein
VARSDAGRFAADGTWQCPTLIRKRTTQLCDAPEYRTDPDLRYVAAGTVRLWSASAGKFAARPASPRTLAWAPAAAEPPATVTAVPANSRVLVDAPTLIKPSAIPAADVMPSLMSRIDA